jgi:hypothetical protein
MVALTLMPSAIKAEMAGMPASVAGMASRRFFRAISLHKRRASASVASVSPATVGLSGTET